MLMVQMNCKFNHYQVYISPNSAILESCWIALRLTIIISCSYCSCNDLWMLDPPFADKDIA
jgi:hypothetical protein